MISRLYVRVDVSFQKELFGGLKKKTGKLAKFKLSSLRYCASSWQFTKRFFFEWRGPSKWHRTRPIIRQTDSKSNRSISRILWQRGPISRGKLIARALGCAGCVVSIHETQWKPICFELAVVAVSSANELPRNERLAWSLSWICVQIRA